MPSTGCSLKTTLSAIDSGKSQSWLGAALESLNDISSYGYSRLSEGGQTPVEPVNRPSAYYLTRGSTYQPPSNTVISGPPQASGYSGYGSHSGPFGYSGYSPRTSPALIESSSASRGCDIPGIGMRPAGEYLEGTDLNCLTCTTYVCTCFRNVCNLTTRRPADSFMGIDRVPIFTGTNLFVGQLGK